MELRNTHQANNKTVKQGIVAVSKPTMAAWHSSLMCLLVCQNEKRMASSKYATFFAEKMFILEPTGFRGRSKALTLKMTVSYIYKRG